ncbi:MAG TPA: nucleoside deaminase [Nitrosospira sp.]|jgi:guanine deaminase|nr:nucleoside deaminase [Nitrosospira sp.]
MINVKRRWLLSAVPGLVLATAARRLSATDAITPGDAMTDHKQLLRKAVRLAQENRNQGGRPFGAVLAIGGREVATGVNTIIQTHDVSAHAEMEALRAACRQLGRPDLKGSVVYASGHPCPMCLAAMIMAKVDKAYYAFSNEEAAPYGFSNAPVYEALHLPLPTSLPLTQLDIGVAPGQLYGS